MEEFTIPFSPIVIEAKLNKKYILELTGIINQTDLTDIYKTIQPKTKEYTFFSAPHENFSNTDHMFRYNVITEQEMQET